MTNRELTLPRNIEAERFVLACSMLDNGVLPQAVGELSIDDFSSEPNRRLFAGMRSLHAQGYAVDPVTLQSELTHMGALEIVGGPAYIGSLTDGVPRFSNIAEYVRLVKESSLKRKALNLARWLMNEASEPDRRVDELVAMLREKTAELEEARIVDDLVSSHTAVDRTMAQLEDRWATGREIIGLASGYPDVDKALLGLRGGRYYCLAAGTGIGKTALAINFSNHILESNPNSVGLIISLEMPVEELTVRQLATATQIDSYQIETGNISDGDKGLIREKADMLRRVSVEYVEGFSKITANSLLSRVQKVRRKHGRIDYLIVDYLQLLDDEEKRENEHARITAISRALKRIAINFNIPVIVLSQLSREHMRRPDKDYILSDLRGSGSIEQDADVVLFLMPADWTDMENPGRRLVIAKNRGGRRDISINLVFFGSQYRFESAESGPSYGGSIPEYGFAEPSRLSRGGQRKQKGNGRAKMTAEDIEAIYAQEDQFME